MQLRAHATSCSGAKRLIAQGEGGTLPSQPWTGVQRGGAGRGAGHLSCEPEPGLRGHVCVPDSLGWEEVAKEHEHTVNS